MRLKLSLGFLLLVILLGVVSAESCSVVDVSADPNKDCPSSQYKIMGLSSQNNSHGELVGQNYYNWALCCDYPITSASICDETTKILGLSADTNAHAQEPNVDTYPVDVCYENFRCTEKSGSCNATEMPLLSLSDSTNAHIAEPNFYTDHIICCNPCPSEEEYSGGECIFSSNAFWSNDGDAEINRPINVDPGKSIIKLILKYSKDDPDTSYLFHIFEDDPDDIRDFTEAIDEIGKAEVDWLITEEDLESGKDCTLGFIGECDINDMEFYFNVNTTPPELSGPLEMLYYDSSGDNFCGDYLGPDVCEDDPGEKADDTINAINSSIQCGYDYKTFISGCYHWTKCSCFWNSSSNGGEGECQARYGGVVDCKDDEDPRPAPGVCDFVSDVGDCSEGVLTLSWDGHWTW
ncbi:MAG: hypothetical protein ABIB79_02290, partial [archaeon]